MLDLILAQAAAPDPQISGAWVLELVAKIFVGIGVLFGAVWLAYKRGQGNPSSETTITNQPLIVREDEDYVTHGELNEHLERIEAGFTELKGDRDEARRVARNALGNVHARINESTTKLDVLAGKVEGINENVGRLVDIAMNRPVGTTIQNQRKKTPN